MSENKLNISRETNALLKKLGLLGPHVSELHITPTTVTATVYTLDRQGNKFVAHKPDEQEPTGFSTYVPTETIEYEVRT